MGGRYDSSRTRVAPVFSALRTRPEPWLAQLLRLPEGGAAQPVFDTLGPVAECAFGGGSQREKRLPAPPSLLRLLATQVSRPAETPRWSEAAREQRNRLFDRDPDTLREALDLIDRGRLTRGWHVFEGPTAPDVYIETPHVLVVIEGKRTEAGPTVDTEWMPGRHQMWRHIDAAWERRGGREVFGFFIVEGDAAGAIPPLWSQAARATLSEAAIESSFPHRNPDERAALRRCFLGVTTWQRVTDALGLPRSVLLDAVEPRRRS